MRRIALAIVAVGLIGGCAPSDQFWKKPDIGARITTLEDALKQPETVRNLDLFNRQQPVFPADILKLKNLERLSLRKNTVVTVPEAIASLTALKWLDLGESGLTDLNPAVGSLPHLSMLYVNDNALTELPGALATLPGLQYLNADRNKLTTLPAALGKSESLKWLRLNDNQITALPGDLSGLARNLKRLYLRGNPIPDPEKARIKQALPNCQVMF
jgi:Leucine-rich repeat (LRR) protein